MFLKCWWMPYRYLGKTEGYYLKHLLSFNSFLLYIIGRSHSQAYVPDAARLYFNFSSSFLIIEKNWFIRFGSETFRLWRILVFWYELLRVIEILLNWSMLILKRAAIPVDGIKRNNVMVVNLIYGLIKIIFSFLVYRGPHAFWHTTGIWLF